MGSNGNGAGMGRSGVPWVVAFDMHDKGGSERDCSKTSTLSMRAVDKGERLSRVSACRPCITEGWLPSLLSDPYRALPNFVIARPFGASGEKKLRKLYCEVRSWLETSK